MKAKAIAGPDGSDAVTPSPFCLSRIGSLVDPAMSGPPRGQADNARQDRKDEHVRRRGECPADDIQARLLYPRAADATIWGMPAVSIAAIADR